jgi:undecaprenyl diphosphate synthase
VPEKLARRIEEAEALTAANTRMALYIAFNYGGRRELLHAAAGLAAEYAARDREAGVDAASEAGVDAASEAGGAAAAGSTAPSIGAPVFTDDDFRRHLYAPEMHDPELLIRTSGELRISNFLLWQCAYSELYFSDRLWPDFDEGALDEALAEYARRQRRFGGRAPDGADDAGGAGGAADAAGARDVADPTASASPGAAS